MVVKNPLIFSKFKLCDNIILFRLLVKDAANETASLVIFSIWKMFWCSDYLAPRDALSAYLALTNTTMIIANIAFAIHALKVVIPRVPPVITI